MLTTTWKKSSRSGPTGDCVEARLHYSHVQVRDSKNVNGPILRASPGDWKALLSSSR
ncbi:DUF397 domain-containing protein [Natronoglycomyces albus]|uniref:DUF397 domain-containing protein n=1 Tax=Natronoglycomyces albus TaxID=2811108 RepID=A0A895XJY9_9ACTN|nr:DUF397 domain-containing protein [Natronoglycomyces albus]QSB06071.1 DUF397 domain-containing protein [Natronoglycomyces albus]